METLKRKLRETANVLGSIVKILRALRKVAAITLKIVFLVIALRTALQALRAEEAPSPAQDDSITVKLEQGSSFIRK